METKKCPHCGEEIMAVAKKCRHCGEWLQDSSDSSNLNMKDYQREPKGLSTSWLVSIVAIAVGVIAIAIEFWNGFSLFWLMIAGYILACFGFSQMLVLTSANQQRVKLNIIKASIVLATLCLFEAGYLQLSYSINVYISGWSILYCIVYPIVIGLGVSSAIYAITFNKSKK